MEGDELIFWDDFLITPAQTLSEQEKSCTTRLLMRPLDSSRRTSSRVRKLSNLFASEEKNSSISSSSVETPANDSKSQAKALTTIEAGAAAATA